MSLTSPEGFTPRREFLRDTTITPNSFSLLAISNANCIRLYSFPLPVLTTLRRLLEQRNLVDQIREDVGQQLCEISLSSKPWSSPKSWPTEKLLVDILAVVYQAGYTFLSTIDYGRESDDRLAMAFSRPATRSLSPLSAGDSPVPASASSPKQSRRVPFALSFLSTTTMRVIAPPLHSTPAILQAVRGSWPRGVVSEKKISDSCFEFKLKGYRWFNEDTFASDSLRHILSLLTSLDAHSFSLLASVSLTGRSRVKDLWIFTGPASSSVDSLPESPAPSILNGSNTDFRRAINSPTMMSAMAPQSQQSLHRKLATEPVPASSSPHALAQGSHMRAATDSPSARNSTTNVLRKAGPRAQVPVSVHDTDTPMPEPEPLRAYMPMPPSGDPGNFASGSGRTPDVFYSTSPLGQTSPPPHHGGENSFPLILPKDDSPEQSSSSQESSPHYTPPLEDSHSPPLSSSLHPDMGESPSGDGEPESPAATPPLLGPTVFRDSAFSSATNSTYDMPIPIKWTGNIRDSMQEKRESLGPMFPGGWQPTPIDERPEDFQDALDGNEANPNLPTPDIQEVPVRVASPDSQSPDVTLRKSEAGLVGLIAAAEATDKPASEGKGWVVVDVEGKGSGDDSDKIVASPVSEPQSPVPASTKAGSGSGTPTAHAIPPAAKAIAIVDAIESKKPSSPTPKSPETSGVKKFFSLGRKNSTATAAQRQATNASESGSTSTQSEKRSATSGSTSSKQPAKAVSEDDTKRAIELVSSASLKNDSEKKDSKSPTKTRLRDRLRLIGTKEAVPNEDKRRSLS